MNQKVSFLLPASKSESNRVLILTALACYQQSIPFTTQHIHNLSEALDTQTLIHILQNQNAPVWDAKDAGTTFRFLSAYAVATHKNVIITGSSRMKERPISVLVEALQTLGANINYKEKKDYPPVEILAKDFIQTEQEIGIRGDVSSQYISALLMIAPFLEKGLNLNLIGKQASRPYIDMTLQQMKSFGVKVDILKDNRLLSIQAIHYQIPKISIESDWSAASYVYAFAALTNDLYIYVPNLKKDSLQGDRKIADLMEYFGVETIWEETGITIHKKKNFIPSQETLQIDFTTIPDLAQTLVVLAASTNTKVLFTGLESLRIKETDRIAALQTELQKFNIEFTETEPNTFTLVGSFNPVVTNINTYKDHRMAMAFAPLLLIIPELTFENPEVVAKSFPHFWQQVKQLIEISIP